MKAHEAQNQAMRKLLGENKSLMLQIPVNKLCLKHNSGQKELTDGSQYISDLVASGLSQQLLGRSCMACHETTTDSK